MISGYNVSSPPLKNLLNLIVRDITYYGFTVNKVGPKYSKQFYEEIPRRVASGEIKHVEDLTRGLEFAGHAIEAVQRGTNKGKSVVIVADD